jgi:hypothetical protein
MGDDQDACVEAKFVRQKRKIQTGERMTIPLDHLAHQRSSITLPFI